MSITTILPNFRVGTRSGLPTRTVNIERQRAYAAAAEADIRYRFVPTTQFYRDPNPSIGRTTDVRDRSWSAILHQRLSSAFGPIMAESTSAASADFAGSARGQKASIARMDAYSSGNPNWWMVMACKVVTHTGIKVIAYNTADQTTSNYGEGFILNNSNLIEVRFGNVAKLSYTEASPSDWHIYFARYLAATDAITLHRDGRRSRPAPAARRRPWAEGSSSADAVGPVRSKTFAACWAMSGPAMAL